MAGCDFIVNVCPDGKRQITWVAGDMIQAWAGVNSSKAGQGAAPEAMDVVVTSAPATRSTRPGTRR